MPDWDRVSELAEVSPGLVNAYHPIGGTAVYAAARFGRGADRLQPARQFRRPQRAAEGRLERAPRRRRPRQRLSGACRRAQGRPRRRPGRPRQDAARPGAGERPRRGGGAAAPPPHDPARLPHVAVRLRRRRRAVPDGRDRGPGSAGAAVGGRRAQRLGRAPKAGGASSRAGLRHLGGRRDDGRGQRPHGTAGRRPLPARPGRAARPAHRDHPGRARARPRAPRGGSPAHPRARRP